ncbi:MAG: glycosyltransferase family 1 protein [Desulfobulbus sp.]|nr:glycosyltransferase family 1 protein [Desulfobulbus sp.]
MRIGIDARTLTFPERRGIANYIIEILRYWPSSDDEFFLFYENGKMPISVETSATIIPVCVPEPPGTRFKVWNWLAMPRALKKYDVDLIWCPANIPIPFIDCMQFLTIHDTLLQESFRKHSIIDSFFYRIIVPYWIRKYNYYIITVSFFSKERICRIFKIDPSIVHVVYNGVSSVIKTCADKLDAQQKLSDRGIVSGKYVYALGAESSWKNTERLLRSFALVHQQHADLMLVVSGIQDSALERYKQLVSSLRLNSTIKLIKFVDDSTRNTLYQGAEMFIYPSLFEGFGFPPLEAMALGCPVISSDKASIPEVVGDGACLIDCTSEKNISDAIIGLVDDEIRKKQLIENGYKNISNFSWKKSAELHRILFEKGSL